MKNPEQIKETWLNRIENGKSREIAREFFHTYTTQEEITRRLYPKAYAIRKKKNQKNFVMPLVTSRVKEWRSYGFFDKSIPLKKQVLRNGKKHKQTFYLSLMNLEPVYEYCKEYKNIDFEPEEKSYLKLLLLNDNYRKLILQEYPEESIIQATLKFYVKNCINKYLFYLRDIRENPKKYKKEITKAGKLNNPTTQEGINIKKWSENFRRKAYKKYNITPKKTNKEFDIIKIIALKKTEITLKKNKKEDIIEYLNKIPLAHSLNHLFYSYITKLTLEPEIVKSTDNNILKALNLLPSI